MLTNQKYEPGSTGATSTDSTVGQPAQAATNNAKHRLSTAEWQNQFLQGLINEPRNQEYFFRVLDMVRDFHDRADPTMFMGEVFNQWIQTTTDLNKARYRIRDFVNHIAFLHELRICYGCFNNDTDYINQSEENGRIHE